MKTLNANHFVVTVSIYLFSLIIFPSCKKEIKQDANSDPSLQKSSKEYIVFDSKEKLKRCLEDLVSNNFEDPLRVLDKYQAPKSFSSYYNTKLQRKDIQTEQQGEEATKADGNKSLIEDLVPDPYFGSILNEKLEVQIENTLVKVSKYGTFMCMPDKLSRVYEIIKELDDSNKSGTNKINVLASTERYPRPAPRQLEPGVVVYERPTRITPVPSNPSNSDPEENNHTYVRPGRSMGGTGGENFVEPLPEPIYDLFPTYDFDATTWAGSLIKDIFGRTKPHFDYFDSKHRVKVNFYNVNFGVYAAAGINVKMQTKGWTSIWRKLDAEELRLGWDGLILKFKMPNMPQPNVPKIDFGKLQIGSINFPIESITLGGNNITKKVKDALNGAIEGQARNALKIIWDYVYRTLAPQQLSAEKKYIKAFKVVYNDEVVIALGRYEEKALNANAITKTFDWNVGFTIKWNPQGKAVNLSDFSAGPNTFKYEIKSGSVYGAAKYYGNWKGARVDKK